MGFPLRATATYRYGDGFRAPRVGRPYWYNQIRGVTSGGRLLRAHDGQDLQVKVGTPVLATFDGVIVDPATIWRPWQPAIYGTVAVVQSSESTSLGYRSISAHLSRLAVAIGDVVQRGQVIGWTGRTGNAAGTVPHLHFELRAPFMILFHYAGIARRLDVFDPRPSLLAADPNR
jgi:murein DD-endopeptidase MepM/ murein hydrolase activator NlpD